MIIRYESQWPSVYARLDQYRKVGCNPFPPSGVEVIWREAKVDRSLNQNALSHRWYEQIWMETREDESPEHVKAFCKLHFGIPILRAHDSEYAAAYDANVKGLGYEQKLWLMLPKEMRGGGMAVTSLMSKAEMSEYLEAVQRHYADRVDLRFPDE